MKTVSLLLLMLLPVVFVDAQQQVAYAKQIPPELVTRKLAKRELQQDIRFWNRVMEESHVNLYHAISRDQLLTLEQELLAVLSDSITHEEALFTIGRIAASLDEGHIGLPSSAHTDKNYLAALRFPFLLQGITDGEWIVREDISNEQRLTAGAHILSVNGVSTKLLTEKYKRLFGGLDGWKNQEICSYIRKLLYLDGIKAPFTVSATTSQGEQISFSLHGLDRMQLDSINKVFAQRSSPEPYTYRVLDNGIGYLDYKQMINHPENPFDAFLEKTFQLIDSQRIKGLVIDLRENGGGNSALGEALVSYISNKPYRFSYGMKWKISEHYKMFLRARTDYNEKDESFYINRKNGTIYTYINKELKTPEKRRYRYTGKVALLIGPNTFSSANMFSDGVTTYHLARVFGQPTSEPGNDFGEVFNFMLPHTGIIARGASKLFTRADGNEKNFEAIQPHVFIQPSKEGLSRKKDPILQAALDWILK